MQGNRIVFLTKASLIKAGFLSLILVLSSAMPAMAQYMTRAQLLESIEVMKKQHASLQPNTLKTSDQRIRQPHEGKGNRSEKITFIRVMLNSQSLGALASDVDLAALPKEVVKMATIQDLNRAHQYLSSFIDNNEFYVKRVSGTDKGLRVKLYTQKSDQLLRVLNDSSVVNEATVTNIIASTPRVITVKEPEGIKPYEPEKWTKESGYNEAIYQLEQSGEEFVVVSFIFRDLSILGERIVNQPYYSVIKHIEKGRDKKQLIRFGNTNKAAIHYRTERLNKMHLEYVYNSPLVSNIVPR